MKVLYEIFPERQLIVQRYLGAVAIGDFIAAAERLWIDPRYSPAYNGLADLTDLQVTVSVADTRKLAQLMAGHPRTTRGKWAAVIASPVGTAFAFIYQRLIRPRHPVEIFSTWEAACAYLDIDLPRTILPAS